MPAPTCGRPEGIVQPCSQQAPAWSRPAWRDLRVVCLPEQFANFKRAPGVHLERLPSLATKCLRRTGVPTAHRVSIRKIAVARQHGRKGMFVCTAVSLPLVAWNIIC